MKILGISGLTGMIGKNFILYYESHKEKFSDLSIVAFVRPTSDLSFLQYHGIEYRTIDYNDIDSFRGKIEDIDVFFHLASLNKTFIPEEYYLSNYTFTKNLFEAIQKYGKNIEHFIFTSSISAAGPAKSKVESKKEQDPDIPVSYYGKSKLKAEEFIRTTDKNWTIVRLPITYGLYDYDGLTFFKMAKNGIIVSAGKDDDYFSYIIAADIFPIVMNIFLNSKTYRNTYYICYDHPVSARDFCKRIRSEMNLNKFFIYFKIPENLSSFTSDTINFFQKLKKKASIVNKDKISEILGKYWICSNEKIKEALKLQSINENGALRELIDWYKKNKYL